MTMNKNYISQRFSIAYLLIFFCFTVFSCSSGGSKLSNSSHLPIPTIPEIKAPGTPLGVDFKPILFIPAVTDSRQIQELIITPNKNYSAIGEITVPIHYALRRTFRLRGFAVNDIAPVSLKVSILKWNATISQESGLAEVIISASVLDSFNEELYSSTYDGFNQFPANKNNQEILQILGQTMSQTIASLLQDKELISLLTAF